MNREMSMGLPPEGMDDIVKKTFGSGEVAGIKLFVNIPAVVISDMTEQLDEMKEVMKDG